MRSVPAAVLLLLAAAAGPAWADQCGPARGEVGRFDYYLLSLSWSPAYCATPAGRDNKRQCGGPQSYGMVVHGLWPQYTDGSWPQCCRRVPDPRPSAEVDKASRVMIGDQLLRHEWRKHGACDLGGSDDYFARINRLVDRLGLAPDLPAAGVERIRVTELKRNWAVPADSIAVRCRGRRLTEVHICLDRGLSPLPCPAAERRADNCPGTVLLGR